jgi:molybdate transport repressor ModE-like protein
VELIQHVRGVRVLLAVADSGSFSAAAAELGLTQSAVSQHVATLERAVGLLLVERGTRPAGLTEAGHVLAQHARAIVARLDSAEQQLAEIAGLRAGRLRFGSFPTALATFVPAALRRFRRGHPQISLTVVDDHLQRLLPRLAERELDVALVYEHAALPEYTAPDVDRVTLFEDPYQLVVARGHRLAGAATGIRLADLAGETWVGGTVTSSWFRIVRSACHDAGFDPAVSISSDDSVAVQAFVSAGLGVAVIPGLAVRRPLPGVVVRPLDRNGPVRTISAVRRRDAYRPPAGAVMIDILEAVTRPLRARAATPPPGAAPRPPAARAAAVPGRAARRPPADNPPPRT